MKEMDEYKSELYRLIDEKNKKRETNRKTVLRICVPLSLCIVIGAFSLIPLIRAGSENRSSDRVQEQIEDRSPDMKEAYPEGEGMYIVTINNDASLAEDDRSEALQVYETLCYIFCPIFES